ncbi:MAG: N-acetylmuramoyl-L-alanine amidase [Myxococcota bacterium]
MRRLLPATLAVVLAAAPALADKADDAYAAAKDSYLSLKKDKQRRQLRHHWQNVARKFEQVARKYPKSDRAPEAFFMAGQLNNELSRISGRGEDVAEAEKSYRRLIDGWPRHRLADDAALALARLLADRKDDAGGARALLEATLANANDMKGDMQRMLAALPKAAPARGAWAPVVAARAEPVRAEAPTALPSANPLADAIRRATSPLAKLSGTALPADELVQARRQPSARPKDDGEGGEPDEGGDAVLEKAEESPIASLQERLRDVRVGAAPGAPDAAEAKSRLKMLATGQKDAELSLAQQLGLKVKRVVVDAGHGGHDTGAIGKNGTREKDVSLSIAKKLAEKLEAMGLEVVLTRDDDTFVKLEDRTRIANREKGDLFISVHCNAAPSPKLHGIETYTLNTSSNRYAIRLAARENATTERGVGDLQYILADLATKANTGESTRLADRVQQTLVRNLSASYKNVKNLGRKEALFFVLLGARMPAVLVETSFLSNEEEEARLADDAYQQAIADSIAEAVDAFLEERNRLAQAD